MADAPEVLEAQRVGPRRGVLLHAHQQHRALERLVRHQPRHREDARVDLAVQPAHGGARGRDRQRSDRDGRGRRRDLEHLHRHRVLVVVLDGERVRVRVPDVGVDRVEEDAVLQAVGEPTVAAGGGPAVAEGAHDLAAGHGPEFDLGILARDAGRRRLDDEAPRGGGGGPADGGGRVGQVLEHGRQVAGRQGQLDGGGDAGGAGPGAQARLGAIEVEAVALALGERLVDDQGEVEAVALGPHHLVEHEAEGDGVAAPRAQVDAETPELRVVQRAEVPAELGETRALHEARAAEHEALEKRERDVVEERLDHLVERDLAPLVADGAREAGVVVERRPRRDVGRRPQQHQLVMGPVGAGVHRQVQRLAEDGHPRRVAHDDVVDRVEDLELGGRRDLDAPDQQGRFDGHALAGDVVRHLVGEQRARPANVVLDDDAGPVRVVQDGRAAQQDAAAGLDDDADVARLRRGGHGGGDRRERRQHGRRGARQRRRARRSRHLGARQRQRLGQLRAAVPQQEVPGQQRVAQQRRHVGDVGERADPVVHAALLVRGQGEGAQRGVQQGDRGGVERRLRGAVPREADQDQAVVGVHHRQLLGAGALHGGAEAAVGTDRLLAERGDDAQVGGGDGAAGRQHDAAEDLDELLFGRGGSGDAAGGDGEEEEPRHERTEVAQSGHGGRLGTPPLEAA